MKGSEAKMTGFMEGADKRYVIPVYQRKYYSAPHCQDTKIKIIRMALLSIRFILSLFSISKS